MSDIEHIGFWNIKNNTNEPDCYTKKDMEAAFIAGRIMYMDKVPFFNDFYGFNIWYKVTRDYERVFQLQKELPIDNVQKEHKGIPET